MQDLSPLSGKISVPSNVNRYHFKVELVLLSDSNTALKIAILVITIVAGVAIAVMYQCKAGGAYPCAANWVRRMKFNKKNEEIQSYSAWHIVMFILYIVGYVGMGFHFITVFHQLIVIMGRGKILKYQDYVPSTGSLVAQFILYNVFFVFKLIEKSTPLVAVYYENG